MKQTLLSFIIICLLAFNTKAQENPNKVIRILGKLINSQNQEGVPFANVGIAGTSIGAASNIDGVFEIKIPNKYKDKTIRISAVGFATFEKNIADCNLKDTIIFNLQSKNYNIDEIKIEAQSLVLLRTIRDAIENISLNYSQKAFSYEVYYKSEKFANKKLSQLRELAATIYDNKGYVRNTPYRVYKERSYKFNQVRKNFQSKSFADSSTYLDELLEMDIVRIRGNILNINNLHNYDFKLLEISEYEDDKVWIIEYKSKKPSLSNTGDYYVKEYSGKIYIKLKDKAIIKNETFVVASNYSKQGRSFYINVKRQKEKPKSIKYNFASTYKQYKGSYFLSYITYNRQHVSENKISKRITNTNIKTQLMITKIETGKPTVIENRSYYENIPYNDKFWNSFNIILENK